LSKRLTLPNTSYITNTYETVARLATTYLRKNDGTVLNKHEYTYNVAGQRTQQIRVDDTYVNYFYDPIGQLTNADCSVASEDRGYFYDTAWNLNRRTNNGVAEVFQVDNKNQLTNAISQVLSFDDNGNTATASNGCNVLVYDDENRLTQWFFYLNGSSQPAGGDKRADFVYDGKSRLRKRIEYTWVQAPSTNPPPEDRPSMEMQEPADATNWTAQLEVRYLYDGNRVIQERDGANTPVVSYTRGTDLSGTLEGAGGIGGLLARSAGYSGGTWTDHVYYHADGNGNISRLYNPSQGSAAYYRYDAFGNMIGQSGTHAHANVYRFSSKEIHTNSGLYYYLYRFYSPNLQRWINRDPLAEDGGINLFSFVHNRPVVGYDSFGLSCKSDLDECLSQLKKDATHQKCEATKAYHSLRARVEDMKQKALAGCDKLFPDRNSPESINCRNMAESGVSTLRRGVWTGYNGTYIFINVAEALAKASCYSVYAICTVGEAQMGYPNPGR
jgi:RHS repeat-associated protein